MDPESCLCRREPCVSWDSIQSRGMFWVILVKFDGGFKCYMLFIFDWAEDKNVKK